MHSSKNCVCVLAESRVEGGEEKGRFAGTEIAKRELLSPARREITRPAAGLTGTTRGVEGTRGGPITVVVAPGRERQRRGTARRRRRRGGPGQSKLFTLKRLHFNIGPKPRDKRRARCLSPSCFRFAPRCCCCCCCCWLLAAALVPLSAACRLNSLFLSRSAPSPPISWPFSLSIAFSLSLALPLSLFFSLLLFLLYPIFFSILALSSNSGGTTAWQWKTSGNIAESRLPDFSRRKLSRALILSSGYRVYSIRQCVVRTDNALLNVLSQRTVFFIVLFRF